MKKTINKIIFIFALVILVNIIPTEAKAATYEISFTSGIVYVNMTMSVHYGTSGYTVGNIAYQNDRILINATVTHPEGQACVWAEVYGWNYADTDGGILSCVPSNPYLATFNYDSILGDLSSGGANSLRFTTPKVPGTYYIRLLAYADDNYIYSQYVDVPFTVSSNTPAVTTTVSWCANADGTGVCTEIPQNASKVTTSAVTPGTPLKFTYKATNLNQGFTCTVNGNTVSPALNYIYTYPATGTVAAGSSTAVFSFKCNNPKVLAVNTDSIGQITGRAVGTSTYVLPTGFTAADRPTEVGLKYAAYSSQFVPDWNHTGTLTQVVCSGNCDTGRYINYISGLASSSSYYIQSYAKNALGTTWGNARKFTTMGSICEGLDSWGNCISCAGKSYSNGDNHCF